MCISLLRSRGRLHMDLTLDGSRERCLAVRRHREACVGSRNELSRKDDMTGKGHFIRYQN